MKSGRTVRDLARAHSTVATRFGRARVILLVVALLGTVAEPCGRAAGIDTPTPTARILVYQRNGPGFVHDNLAASAAALHALGLRHGFAVDVSTNAALFSDENLSGFRAVVFANSNNDAFEHDDQRAAFRRFLERGGGFVGIHSSTGSERNWAWFQQMQGAKFLRHSPLQPFTVRRLDDQHPATAHLPARWSWTDECYFFTNVNPSMRVLLTVNTTTLRDSKLASTPGQKASGVFPLAWCQENGGSRRFYTSLGHRSITTPTLLSGSICWAASNGCSQPVRPPRSPSPDETVPEPPRGARTCGPQRVESAARVGTFEPRRQLEPLRTGSPRSGSLRCSPAASPRSVQGLPHFMNPIRVPLRPRGESELGLSRRRFLRRASVAVGALGFPTLIPAHVLGAAAPSSVLRIAQIGCGRIARDMDLPGVLKHPQLARIVAVADVDAHRAELARRQIEASYAKSLAPRVTVSVHRDYHELLGRSDIDAVMISTPDHWHAQPVVEAALAGKDIYVQKPLSLTLAEGRLASDAVRASGRILQIGSQQRSTAQFHRACDLVRNGVLGRIKQVRIGLPVDPPGGRAEPMPVPSGLNYDAWLGSTPEAPYTEDRVHPQSDDVKKAFGRPGWLRLNAHTCGMITGWGSHHVDIAHWALDAELSGPLSVDAHAKWPGNDSFWNVHGSYEVKLTYPNDITVTISDALPNGVRFEGEHGWIWVTRGSATSPQSINSSQPRLLAQAESDRKVALHRSPGWDHHLDWLEAIRNRKEAVTNVETGHRSCSACVVSWIGMKLGRPLKWDPVREQFPDDAEANRMLDRPEREPYGAFAAARKAGFKAFKSLGQGHA